MIKIGVSSACYYPELTESALESIGASGIKATEIFFNADSEHKPDFLFKLKEIRDKYQIDIVSLHPALSLAESYYFFSDYERRFDEYRKSFCDYYEAAKILGSKYIILHGAKLNPRISEEEIIRRFDIISADAKNSGVTLLQENVNGYLSQNPQFIKKMRELTCDRARFCLDIKQAVRAGYTENEIMDAMGNNFLHIHISDSNESNDCLLPKNGSFDFSGFFALLKEKNYSGHCMIEVYRNAYKDSSEIAESFYKMQDML